MDQVAAQPAAPADASPPGGRDARFLYASGARPLSGYTIKRGVGHGGFGEVYFAVSDGGKEVALKLIRRNLDIELRGVAQCLNLKHPNLIALYDVRQDDEQNSWVIMEYVAGQPLDAVIRSHPQGLPAAEAVDWLRGIAAGVACLHSHGIVHRDLKPANVFRDEGLVKLGDYGLSKFISASRRSGQTDSIGTVHYMAPEIARGRYGKEIDIYALGVMLYEMLTGSVPFEGESVGEVLMKHLTAEPDTSCLEGPLRAVVDRALAKDPAQRFATVEEFLTALPPGNGPLAGRSEVPIALAPAAPRAAVPIVMAASDEEPVGRFFRREAQQAWDYWQNGNLSTPVKISLVLMAVYFLPDWINALLFALLAYAGYRLVRWFVRLVQGKPAVTAPPRVASVASMPHGDALAVTRTLPAAAIASGPVELAKPVAPPVSLRQCVADLIGSLLFATLVAATLAVVMVLVRGEAAQPEQFAWLALTSMLGTWTVLVTAKLWERVPTEEALRRFVLLIVGLALGAAAYGLDQGLLVDLPFEIHSRWRPDVWHHLPTSFYSPLDGAPLLPAFLAYFGFLFVVVRWWLAAEPERHRRLSLWTTARAVLAAWLVNLFWPFPQPWGLMVAAIVSVSVQLASPWRRGRASASSTSRIGTQ